MPVKIIEEFSCGAKVVSCNQNLHQLPPNPKCSPSHFTPASPAPSHQALHPRAASPSDGSNESASTTKEPLQPPKRASRRGRVRGSTLVTRVSFCTRHHRRPYLERTAVTTSSSALAVLDGQPTSITATTIIDLCAGRRALPASHRLTGEPFDNMKTWGRRREGRRCTLWTHLEG